MATEITLVGEQTFKVIKSATDKLVDFVKATFGPAGSKVIISKQLYSMEVDDGVQAARDFELSDPAENAIVKIIRKAAISTNDRVGDSTTGSLIVLQAIINEVSRKSRIEGWRIERELKKAVIEAKSQLLKMARQIKTQDELRKGERISFSDEQIADMIADAYFKIGRDGVITIDKSPTMNTTIEMTNGTKIETGYISPYFINNPERMEGVIEKPYILITDYRLTENTDILPIMEKVSVLRDKNLVVIAENVEQNAMATLIINQPHVMNPETRKLGSFPSVAIALPKVEDRTTLLEDLA